MPALITASLVASFGTDAYQGAIESIMDKIRPQAFEVSCYQNELESLKEAIEGEDVAD